MGVPWFCNSWCMSLGLFWDLESHLNRSRSVDILSIAPAHLGGTMASTVSPRTCFKATQSYMLVKLARSLASALTPVRN